MKTYCVKLRYYPGDPLVEIREEDLKRLARFYDLDIAFEKIERRQMQDGMLMEETVNSRIEDITQEVVIVSGDNEKEFSDCIKALFTKYRCPRTAYSLLGSNPAGEKISKGLMNLYGGWE
jgi:hypothetical protein